MNTVFFQVVKDIDKKHTHKVFFYTPYFL